MAELGERKMDWGERLSRLLTVSGEKPLLEALECGMETLEGMASGEVEVTPGMERLVEGLEVIYLGAVAWPEERAYDGVPGDGDAARPALCLGHGKAPARAAALLGFPGAGPSIPASSGVPLPPARPLRPG